MTKSRWFRVLICLLMVCCLVLHLSPIKAQAVALELAAGTAVAVAGGLVVASVIIGLGVQTGAMTTAWDSLVNDCHQYLISEGLAELDGTIKVMAVKGLAFSFAVSQEIIEAVRSFLFASGAIQETVVAIQDGNWYYNGFYAKPYPQNVDLSLYPYILMGYSNNDLVCIFSSQPLLVDYVSEGYKTYWGFYAEQTVNVLTYISAEDTLAGWDLFKSVENIEPGDRATSINAYVEQYHGDMWANYDIFGTERFNYGECLLPGMSAVTEDCTLVTTAPGYTAGTIAEQQVDTEIGYELWYGNAVEISTGTSDSDGSEPERKPYWPIGLPATLTDAYELQQEDIWNGSNSTLDPEDPNNPDSSLDDPTPDDSTDKWEPPTNPGKFALDLKEFFPFCIPFDLYDFFSCLNADPVAPVIDWAIPLPGGSSYPITIDLSIFDPVAKILRTMELLLFCVGLAFKTRDLIRG